MSPEVIGALGGLGVGILSYVTLAFAARHIEGDGRDAAKVRQAELLRTVGKFEVLLLAGIGYFIGPMVLS